MGRPAIQGWQSKCRRPQVLASDIRFSRPSGRIRPLCKAFHKGRYAKLSIMESGKQERAANAD